MTACCPSMYRTNYVKKFRSEIEDDDVVAALNDDAAFTRQIGYGVAEGPSRFGRDSLGLMTPTMEEEMNNSSGGGGKRVSFNETNETTTEDEDGTRQQAMMMIQGEEETNDEEESAPEEVFEAEEEEEEDEEPEEATAPSRPEVGPIKIKVTEQSQDFDEEEDEVSDEDKLSEVADVSEEEIEKTAAKKKEKAAATVPVVNEAKIAKQEIKPNEVQVVVANGAIENTIEKSTEEANQVKVKEVTEEDNIYRRIEEVIEQQEAAKDSASKNRQQPQEQQQTPTVKSHKSSSDNSVKVGKQKVASTRRPAPPPQDEETESEDKEGSEENLSQSDEEDGEETEIEMESSIASTIDSLLISRQLLASSAAATEKVYSWQMGSTHDWDADRPEFDAALETLAREMYGKEASTSDLLPLLTNLTCTLPRAPHLHLPQQINILTSLLTSRSSAPLTLSILNHITTLSALLHRPHLGSTELSPLMKKLCSLTSSESPMIRNEASVALQALIRGLGPGNVAGPLLTLAGNEKLSFRLRKSAIDGYTFGLLVFPREECKIQEGIGVAVRLLTSPQRVLRQSSLEALSVLAHIIGPSVALPLFKSVIPETSRAGSAISARVSRRVLPSISGSGGVIDYGLELPMDRAELEPVAASGGLSPIVRRKGGMGADVSWILGGCGPVQQMKWDGAKECRSHQLIPCSPTRRTVPVGRNSLPPPGNIQKHVPAKSFALSPDDEELYEWSSRKSRKGKIYDYDNLADQLQREQEKVFNGRQVINVMQPEWSTLQPLHNTKYTESIQKSCSSSSAGSSTRDSGVGSLRRDLTKSTSPPSYPINQLRPWQSSPNVISDELTNSSYDTTTVAVGDQNHQSSKSARSPHPPHAPVEAPPSPSTTATTSEKSELILKPVLGRPTPKNKRHLNFNEYADPLPQVEEPDLSPERDTTAEAEFTLKSPPTESTPSEVLSPPILLNLDDRKISHVSDDSLLADEYEPVHIKPTRKEKPPVKVYKGSYHAATTSKSEPTSIFPPTLKPLDSPRAGLSLALAKLNSEDWETVNEGFRLLVRLIRFHPEALRGDLHLINLTGIKHLTNLRSQVSRAACSFFQEMFESGVGKKVTDSDCEKIIEKLLDKSAASNKFIREDAMTALLTMVHHMPPAKALSALDIYGTRHRNGLVRCSTARATSLIVLNVGPEKCFSELGEKLLPMLVQLLLDGSLETRTHAKKSVAILAEHRNFDSQMKRHVAPEAYRHASKTIGLIKHEVKGRRPF